MTWFAFSCSWLRLSPPMGCGLSRDFDFWLGAVGHRVEPVVVMSSRSKSCSLARFSFCKASYSTSGWFQIWRKTENQSSENTSQGDACCVFYLFVHLVQPKMSFPHLTADTKRLQWVEAEPPSVPSLFETVHKLSVKRPLQGRQTHQDHMFLFRGQLVSQDVMTSSGMETNIWSVRVKIPSLTRRRCLTELGMWAPVVSPLHKTLQEAMQDVAPVPHQPDVLRCAVHTLPIQNGTFKHVTELLPCAWNRYRKSSNVQQENRQTLNSVF